MLQTIFHATRRFPAFASAGGAAQRHAPAPLRVIRASVALRDGLPRLGDPGLVIRAAIALRGETVVSVRLLGTAATRLEDAEREELLSLIELAAVDTATLAELRDAMRADTVAAALLTDAMLAERDDAAKIVDAIIDGGEA